MHDAAATGRGLGVRISGMIRSGALQENRKTRGQGLHAAFGQPSLIIGGLDSCAVCSGKT